MAVGAVDLREAAVLDRVTDRRTGAVGLHHADRCRLHARRRQRRPVHRDLRVLGRHHQRLGATILIGGRAAHHGEDPVAVAPAHRAVA